MKLLLLCALLGAVSAKTISDSSTCDQTCRVPGGGKRPAPCHIACKENGCVKNCMLFGESYMQCVEECFPGLVRCYRPCYTPGGGSRPASCIQICKKNGCVEKCMNTGKDYQTCQDSCFPKSSRGGHFESFPDPPRTGGRIKRGGCPFECEVNPDCKCY